MTASPDPATPIVPTMPPMAPRVTLAVSPDAPEVARTRASGAASGAPPVAPPRRRGGPTRTTGHAADDRGEDGVDAAAKRGRLSVSSAAVAASEGGAESGKRALALATMPRLLMLTPPRDMETTLEGQIELLKSIVGQDGKGRPGVAFEVAGNKDGVGLFARAATTDRHSSLRTHLQEFYPQGTVAEVLGEDPAFVHEGESAEARELFLDKPDYLPLRPAAIHEEDQEMTYQFLAIIRALRGLPEDMTGVCQLSLWPAQRGWADTVLTNKRYVEQKEKLSGKAGGSDTDALTDGVSMLVKALLSPVVLMCVWPVILGVFALLLWSGRVFHVPGFSFASAGAGGAAPTMAIDFGQMFGSGHAKALKNIAMAAAGAPVAGFLINKIWKPKAPMDPAMVEAKLSTPPLGARLKVLVRGGTPAQRILAIDTVVDAYAGYQQAGGNTFVAKKVKPESVINVTGHFGAYTLSGQEARALFMVPPSTVDVPGLKRGGARGLLPADVALEENGIKLGFSRVGGVAVDVHLPIAAVTSHGYIPGATGTGKSTIFQHLFHGFLALRDRDLSEFYDHPVMGTHVIVVDPHGTLAKAIAGSLTPEQARNTVVLRFGYGERSIGINVLDTFLGRDDEFIINSLNKMGSTFWDGAWGPRMEAILRHACLTALGANRTRPREGQFTLLDVVPILLLPTLRADVQQQIDDEMLRPYLTGYWRDDYGKLPPNEQITQRSPIIYKIRSYMASKIARRILGQATTTIDLAQLIREGKNIIIDTGGVSEDVGKLLNATIIGMIADIVRARGNDFDRHLLMMIDEFHTIPTSWSSLMTGIRKFGMSCWMAAQGLANLELTEEKLDDFILNNVATLIAFRIGNDRDGERMAKLMDDEVTFKDLKNQGLRQCYVKTTNGRMTLPVFSMEIAPPPATSIVLSDLIADATLAEYGTPNDDIDRELNAWAEKINTYAEEGTPENEATADADAADLSAMLNAFGLDTEDGVMGPGSTPAMGLSATRPAVRDAPKNGAKGKPDAKGKGKGRGRGASTDDGAILPVPDAATGDDPFAFVDDLDDPDDDPGRGARSAGATGRASSDTENPEKTKTRSQVRNERRASRRQVDELADPGDPLPGRD